jgi:hypothetical protein
MAHDQQSLKAFLNDTRKRSADILDQPHVGADVKSVIRDLLQTSDSFYESLINPPVNRQKQKPVFLQLSSRRQRRR